MNTEKQRIAIATWLGYKLDPSFEFELWIDPDGGACEELPDFPGSKDAMSEFLLRLNIDQRCAYIGIIQRVCERDFWNAKQEGLATAMHSSSICFASSQQQCEASVRTIGKWDD